MRVNVDTFVRVETALQLDRIVAMAGGVNRWAHNRVPTPIDQQNVIRMNRDTLYSFAVVDLSAGATVTLPDAAGRYLSVMAVNEDHHINRVFHDAGTHELTVEELGTEWVLLAARTLVDPEDADDVAVVHALQDGLGVSAAARRAWQHPEYDEASYTATRDAILALAAGVSDTHRMFGSREAVDPVRHLLGTAAGWGGLPETEAFYVLAAEPLPVGTYELTVRDVPVDGFWSISVYNRDGFFEANPDGSYSVNSVTATRSADGSVTVHLAPTDTGEPNYLHVMDGWNYTVRLYRPRPAILDGSWTFPAPRAR